MVVTTLEGAEAVPPDAVPEPGARPAGPAVPGAAVPPPISPCEASPAGDPPSWDDVVRDHGARVYRLAYRLTGNKHDAEDLTQEVFVRVFRSLSQYTPGSFEGWLHRITTNLFLDQVRRRRRIRFDALPDDAADRLPGRDVTPDQRHADRLLDGDVQAALDSLPPEFRAAVVLCDIEGLTYEEVAAALDIKLGTVRSRIHRGRAQLRAALAHRAPRTGTATRLPTVVDPAGSVARRAGGRPRPDPPQRARGPAQPGHPEPVQPAVGLRLPPALSAVCRGDV